MKSIIASAKIESKIHVIRNHSVMLDSDLARLYGVTTKSLNQAVRRNLDRFPSDFAFRLAFSEAEILRSQFVTSSLRFQIGTSSWGGRRYKPYAFTQEGVAMLSSVLNSPRAIQVNIQIMRAFIRLRGFQYSVAELRREIQTMRKKYDGSFASVFNAIGKILDGPKKKVQVRGFSQIKEG